MLPSIGLFFLCFQPSTTGKMATTTQIYFIKIKTVNICKEQSGVHINSFHILRSKGQIILGIYDVNLLLFISF